MAPPVIPRSPAKDAPSGEAAAAEWPPAEYRTWVQSQIANKMLLTLGGFGIGTLVLVVSSYFAVQNWVLNTQQTAIKELVVADIKDWLPGQIAVSLIRNSELLVTAEQEIENEIPELLSQHLQIVENRAEIARRIMTEITENRDLQAIILNETLDRAKRAGTSPTTRAMALQMFILFHGGEVTTPPGPKMREQIALLVETAIDAETDVGNVRLDPIPQQLMATILRNYPMGYREDPECQEHASECEIWDRRVLDVVLAHLEAEQGSFNALRSDYTTFFRAVRPGFVDQLKVWLTDNHDNRAALTVASAIMSPTNNDALERALPIMVSFVTSDRAGLHALGLQALATIDAHAAVSENTRADALHALWRGLPVGLLESAFTAHSDEPLLASVETLFQGENPFDPISLIERRRDLIDRALDTELPETRFHLAEIAHSRWLHTALTNLVRTTNQGSDWDSIFRAKLLATGSTLPEARTRNGFAYRLWAERILYDQNPDQNRDPERAQNVSVSADRMLTTLPSGFLHESHPHVSVATAIRFASREKLANLIHHYAAEWSGGPQRPLGDILAALLNRDRAFDQPHQLLGNLLDRTHQQQAMLRDPAGLREHALQVALGPDRQDQGKLPTSEILNLVARRATMLLSSSDAPETALCLLLIGELRRALDNDDYKSHTIGAIERASLLSAENANFALADAIRSLHEQLPWIGDEVAEYHALTIDDGGTGQFVLPAGEAARWYRVSSAQDLRYTVRFSQGLEVIFADVTRTSFKKHSGPDEQTIAVSMPAGTFAVGLRRLEPGGGSELSAQVSGLSAPPQIHPNSRDAPYEVATPSISEVIVGDDEESGTIWQRFSAREGQFVHVETMPSGRQNEIDTVVELYDADNLSSLGSDDDDGWNAFSSLLLEVDRDRDFLLNVFDWDEDDFQPGSTFLLSVSVLTPDARVSGETFMDQPAPLSIDVTTAVDAFDGSAWLVFEPDHAQLLSVASTATFWINEESLEGPLAFSSGHMVDAVTSNDFFLAHPGRRYLIELEAPPDDGKAVVNIEPAGVTMLEPAPELAMAASGVLTMNESVAIIVEAGPNYFTLQADETREVALEIFVDSTVPPFNISVLDEAMDVYVEVSKDTRAQFQTVRWRAEQDHRYTIAIEVSVSADPLLVTNGILPEVQYDGYGVGDRVILGQHEEIDGERFWDDEMERYVGCIGSITGLRDSDPAGQYVVAIDEDKPQEIGWNNFLWRTRNLRPVAADQPQQPHCQFGS